MQHTTLELLIPDTATSRRGKRPMVAFLATTPRKGWQYEDGELHWSVGDVRLLDGSFSIYPGEQLDAVVSVVELAVAGQAGEANVAGSVINLFTRPHDARCAVFGAATPSCRREAVAPVVDVATEVVDRVHAWMEHLPLVPPPRPSSEPGPGVRDEYAQAMMSRVSAIRDRLDRRRGKSR